MSICKKTLFFLLITTFTVYSFSEPAQLKKKIFTIILNDISNNEVWLPHIGEFPLFIIYEDFRNLGDNYKFYKTLSRLKIPEERFKTIYISNTEPAWLTPDILINYFFKERENMYPGIVFLFDWERSLQTKWRLLDSDKKSVIILVNRKSEIEGIWYDIPDKESTQKIINKIYQITAD